MNQIYLMLDRFRQYYLKNKRIFVLLFVCGIVNVLAVVYCYGNLLPSVANRYSPDYDFRDFFLRFDETPAQPADIKKLTSSPLVQSWAFSDGSGVYSYDGKYPLTRLRGTVDFTDKYQIIAPPVTDLSVGDQITYRDYKFEVIGVAQSVSGGYLIQQEMFEELGATQEIKAIHFLSAEHQPDTIEKISELVNKTVPYYTYFGGPAFTMAVKYNDTTTALLIFILINALLSVISYSFILEYILSSVRKENAILVLLGSTKGKISSMILLEALGFAVLINGAGILLHKLLYKPVFMKLNVDEHIRYEASDYWYIFLIMLIMTLVVAIPKIIRIASATPVTQRRTAL